MTRARGLLGPVRVVLGRKIAPPRFVLFVAVLGAGFALRHFVWGHGTADSLVVAFDIAALLFALSLLPYRKDHAAAEMRCHSASNDANRLTVLIITGLVALTILAAISSELPAARQGSMMGIAKLVVTLLLAWLFTSLVFMLHYAHMHYAPGDQPGTDRGGFAFPGTAEPDYWDFLYFSLTAAMSFAASDVDVTRGDVRRIVVLHSLLSFLFNLGVLAFSINVLAGAAG